MKTTHGSLQVNWPDTARLSFYDTSPSNIHLRKTVLLIGKSCKFGHEGKQNSFALQLN